MLLNNHSYYSLRYGTFSEEELLRQAQSNDYKSIALTDINNTSACLNFIRLAEKYRIKPIVGIDFRNGAQQQFVGIAKNNNGFLHLNNFLSCHSHKKIPIPKEAPELKDCFIIYPFQCVIEIGKKDFTSDEYIGIRWQDLDKLSFNNFSKWKEKLVILQTITFRNKRDFNVHRLLRAIDNNTLLSKLDVSEQAKEEEVMWQRLTLLEKFKEHEYIVKNTKKIIGSCQVHFDFSKEKIHQNKLTFYETKAEDERKIRELCKEGLYYRYKIITPEIEARLEKELNMIQKKDFIPFFLINWDIIQYAKRQGYFHVGRGSGANSIVAYLLGITDVDPIELDLYFERFMNLYRSTPPDFDIDFNSRDREDVTRYIFEKYGSTGQAALLATYNTFKHSAAVRELGKVFGLPKHEIDKLSKGRFSYNRLDKLSQLVLTYAKRLEGLPNYLSIHAGGIIISEKPIHYFTATDLPPKGFPTTQFDMVMAEDVGLNKYDILGQRGLGKIKDAIQIIKVNQPNTFDIDIHDVKPFFKDANINRMVSKAECIGCFYVESPAMRMLLKKLEVDNYHGLVAASSIIRPGVAKSGMMREYILRHKNPERRKNAHPVLKSIMPDTYGVMVYQEDVIKVAHYFAGLDLGEADILRRGMSGKYRSREEFEKVKKKFVSNCRAKGYADDMIFDVWRQIESFAGYAFAKGHSASYAVESYQSLYLKTYYPLEYMVAVLNNGGGFYRSELYVHEARKLGAIIHAPCINRGYYLSCIYGKDIYLGFHMIQSLESKVIISILKERNERGEYQSLENFLERVEISIEQLELLIRVNAFRTCNQNKKELLWKAHFILNMQPSRGYIKSLFGIEPIDFKFPRLDTSALEDAFDQIELLGFSLSSPFSLLKERLEKPVLLARELPKYHRKQIEIYGYLITVKNTTTSGGKRMHFGTFLDYEGEWIDTVHFPPIAKKYPFRGKGIYKLEGVVVEEFGFYSLEVNKMSRMPYLEDIRFSDVRQEEIKNVVQKRVVW